ncbi:MAG: shikimate kinase, partial [Bacteroidetes bacterium]
RDIEAELITELSKSKNTVIACGGGTPCFGNNMSVMNDSGYTVYLELNENELFTRLNNEKDNRPLITDLNEDKLKAYIQKTLSKRMPFYLQAQEVINANIKNVPEITEDILRLLP